MNVTKTRRMHGTLCDDQGEVISMGMEFTQGVPSHG